MKAWSQAKGRQGEAEDIKNTGLRGPSSQEDDSFVVTVAQ